MSTTTPTKPPTATLNPNLITYGSWGALILSPIIILLPPRKLDFYTLGLLGTMFVGGNQISKEYTGTSMAERLGTRAKGLGDTSLPLAAQETQRKMQAERAARAARDGKMVDTFKKEGVVAAMEEQRRAKEVEEKGMLEKIWMGGEGEDWKKKRDQREKEALEEGRGYTGLIMDQIWEVWSWGKDKNDEVKKIDEKVVAERKEEKKR